MRSDAGRDAIAHPAERTASNRDFRAGGGETGSRLRALDWTRTPLGDPENEPVDERLEETSAPSGPPRRILVVDDNQDVAQSLAMLRAPDHHEVDSVYTPQQAHERAQSFKPVKLVELATLQQALRKQ